MQKKKKENNQKKKNNNNNLNKNPQIQMDLVITKEEMKIFVKQVKQEIEQFNKQGIYTFHRLDIKSIPFKYNKHFGVLETVLQEIEFSNSLVIEKIVEDIPSIQHNHTFILKDTKRQVTKEEETFIQNLPHKTIVLISEKEKERQRLQKERWEKERLKKKERKRKQKQDEKKDKVKDNKKRYTKREEKTE